MSAQELINSGTFATVVICFIVLLAMQIVIHWGEPGFGGNKQDKHNNKKDITE